MRKNSGIASWRSSRTGTPASFSGRAAKTRKSGRVCTWTAAYRRRRCSRVAAHAARKRKARDSPREVRSPAPWCRCTSSRSTRTPPPRPQMAVYAILVTLIFQRSVPDYPLFVFAAILPWKWFTTAIGDAIASVSGQDRLIKQIKFPQIVLPAAVMPAGIAQFAFGLIPLAAMLVLMYPARISPMLVFIPVVAAVQFVFTVGLGLLLAAGNVFFRGGRV